MRSKAHDLRQQEWQSKHADRPARGRTRKVSNADTARPTVSASDRKAARDEVGLAHEHAGINKGGAVLEESMSKPSRKSTRKSSDHTKRTTNQQNRAMMKARSPKERQARNAVKKA